MQHGHDPSAHAARYRNRFRAYARRGTYTRLCRLRLFSGFASSLKGPRCTIQTVEHLLATCHMYGLTNLLVKVSEEVPIFDGSARDICAKIEEAGMIEQKQGVSP